MQASTAILLVQTGTPADASSASVRRFLEEFLSDPFVIHSAGTRWALKHFFLPLYLKKSVQRYQRFFGQHGHALADHTVAVTKKMQETLNNEHVVYAMRYGEPSLPKVLNQLAKDRISKITLIPLFPQYSHTTTGSIEDTATRTVHELNTDITIEIIKSFYQSPEFIDSLTTHINAHLPKDTDHLFLSYHSLPVAYTRKGDPYIAQCLQTTDLLKEKIALPNEKISHVYQSKMGLGKWQGPFLKNELKRSYQQGLKNVAVAFPGFLTDCLETLGEVGDLAAYWQKKGMSVKLIPCLNDYPSFPIASTGHSPMACSACVASPPSGCLPT